MERIKTILIDDEPEAINRLRRLLKHFTEIEIIENDTDPLSGTEKIIVYKPDLVFIDVEMPGRSGFEVIEIVAQKGVKPKYIITTGYDHYMLKAIRAQAFDYLIKPIDVDELKEMLDRFIHEHKSKKEQLESNIHVLAKEKGLTQREAEILPYLLKGQTSESIAESLFISKNTVDTHRRRILHKFNIKSTSELIYKLTSDLK